MNVPYKNWSQFMATKQTISQMQILTCVITVGYRHRVNQDLLGLETSFCEEGISSP